MSIPFVLNGAGRIGRALLRVVADRTELELLAVNELATAPQLANLLARDSVHGPFAGEVASTDDSLVINGRQVPVFAIPSVQSLALLLY